MPNPFNKQFDEAVKHAKEPISRETTRQLLGLVAGLGSGGRIPKSGITQGSTSTGKNVIPFPKEKARPPGDSGNLLAAGVRTFETVKELNKMGDMIAQTQLADAKAGGAKVEAEESEMVKKKNRQGALSGFIGDVKAMIGTLGEESGMASGTALDAALDNMAFKMGIEPEDLSQEQQRTLLQGLLDQAPSLGLRVIPPMVIKMLKLKVR